MSTTRRGQGGEGDSPVAPPIPSFASLRAPRRSSPAMDWLAPAPVETRAGAEPSPAAQPARPPRPAGPAQPRPAEWPDLLRFGMRLAQGALRLPGVLACLPARRLRRLLGE
ncbi:hypothetical protein [Candidatus Blastococcus massiliensis]|uniref:hypothetical protein n=1 Tax=Candidatus Blastococcus massiliensis TaxID=1470358 RepID=UPI0004BA8E2F|nr:hypothetical protein [Candidatus Blastococcus massiliensis]